MRQLAVEECSKANKEHQSSQRQYAHVFHRDGVICVSRAFWDLPERLRLAILLHEAGHVLAGPRGGELAANRAAERYSGIPIEYRSCKHGEELESISPRYVQQAKEALGLSGTSVTPSDNLMRQLTVRGVFEGLYAMIGSFESHRLRPYHGVDPKPSGPTRWAFSILIASSLACLLLTLA